MSKTVFITGGSRGIGKAIGLILAKKGYNIVIAAKTTEPQATLEGTIYTAAEEIEKAGGKALPIQLDVRNDDAVKLAVEQAVQVFGGIDILINNASAIGLSNVEDLPMKRYDLFMDINVRGTYFLSKTCIPYLKNGNNPHILNLSPPLNLDKKWFVNHTAYTISKMSMSMIALGLSEELKEYGIAANTLWPQTAIATAAVKNLGGEAIYNGSRNTDIMTEAAEIILSKNSREFTGNFVIDEDILRKEKGITNFDSYAIDPNSPLAADLFV